MSTHKTVFDDGFNIEKTDDLFDYQTDLTNKLDNFNQAFDQQIINEIVLWKVNRYAPVTKETIELLNKIDANSTELEIKLTREVLKSLLETKGIQLPMASTILRFKNEKIYQIIDQRVYRIINKEKKLKIKTYPTEKNIDKQININ